MFKWLSLSDLQAAGFIVGLKRQAVVKLPWTMAAADSAVRWAFNTSWKNVYARNNTVQALGCEMCEKAEYAVVWLQHACAVHFILDFSLREKNRTHVECFGEKDQYRFMTKFIFSLASGFLMVSDFKHCAVCIQGYTLFVW